MNNPDKTKREYERTGRRLDLLLFLRKTGEIKNKDLKLAAQLGDQDCLNIFPSQLPRPEGRGLC